MSQCAPSNRAIFFPTRSLNHCAAKLKKSYVDLDKERERFAERAYDAAVCGYLLTGVMDDKLQREMIAVVAQLHQAGAGANT